MFCSSLPLFPDCCVISHCGSAVILLALVEFWIVLIHPVSFQTLPSCKRSQRSISGSCLSLESPPWYGRRSSSLWTQWSFSCPSLTPSLLHTLTLSTFPSLLPVSKSVCESPPLTEEPNWMELLILREEQIHEGWCARRVPSVPPVGPMKASREDP